MLTSGNFRALLALSLPEIEALVGRKLDYLSYDPPPGIILGDIIWPYITDFVEGRHKQPLDRVFQFVEAALDSEDWELRNAVGVNLIEGLVPSAEAMAYCWPLMGPKTREMAVTFAEALGYTENLPEGWDVHGGRRIATPHGEYLANLSLDSVASVMLICAK